jgi:hypothetical protein
MYEVKNWAIETAIKVLINHNQILKWNFRSKKLTI